MMTKKHKISAVICLTITILLNAFILFESLLPGGLSSLQSNFFSNWFAGLINDNVSVSQDIVPLENIQISNSTSDDNLVIGTTKSLNVSLIPENASDQEIEYYAQPSESVNLVSEGKTVYVEAINEDAINKQVKIYARSNQKETYYTFNIVERLKPQDFKASINDYTMMTNTSQNIDIVLGHNNTYDDPLLAIRYYDITKLSFSSSNEEVAICKDGVIYAKQAGTATIYINHLESNEIKFDIEVIENPNPLVGFTKDDFKVNINGENFVYDIDEARNDNSKYFSQIEIEFLNGIQPSDTNFSYEVIDNVLCAIVNSDGKIYGYKKIGVATIRVTSNMDETVYQDIKIDVKEVIANQMDLTTESITELMVGKNLSITPTFYPSNTTNKNLIATINDQNLAKVSSGGRTIVISALKKGDAIITITSMSNPSLKVELNLKIIEKQAINENNYNDFHSFVRKAIGHFFLFFVDGILCGLTMYLLFKNKRWYNEFRSLLIACAFGFTIGWMSEFLQIFAKRGASIQDIFIDFVGFVFGAFTLGMIIMIVKLIYSKKQKGKDDEKQ